MRASDTDSYALCKRKAQMEEGIPDEDTQESREGTMLHTFMAHPEYERRVLGDKQQDLLHLADDLEEQVFDIVIQNEKIKDSEEYVEQREVEGAIELESSPHMNATISPLTGHMDLWRRYPARSLSIIIDWKFGWLPVPRAEFNLQLRSYAVLAQDERVYVAIGQPRASYNERMTLAVYNATDLVASRAQLLKIDKDTKDPNAPLLAGEAQCRYCKAKMICPAFKAAYTQGLVPLGTFDQADSKAKRLGIVEARLSSVTDDQIGAMMEATKLVEFIYEPLMDEARRRISAGQMDGYKLGKAFERRKITNSQQAVSRLLLAGMSREDIMSCASLSLSKLEDKALSYCNKDRKTALEYVAGHLSSVLESDPVKQKVIKK